MRLGPKALRLGAGAHRWCRCPSADGVCPADATCDGVPFELPRERWIGICCCGQTKTPPECDGSHAGPGLLARLQARLRRKT